MFVCPVVDEVPLVADGGTVVKSALLNAGAALLGSTTDDDIVGDVVGVIVGDVVGGEINAAPDGSVTRTGGSVSSIRSEKAVVNIACTVVGVVAGEPAVVGVNTACGGRVTGPEGNSTVNEVDSCVTVDAASVVELGACGGALGPDSVPCGSASLLSAVPVIADSGTSACHYDISDSDKPKCDWYDYNV